eukprot:Gb_12254 [translate_table: standard]
MATLDFSILVRKKVWRRTCAKEVNKKCIPIPEHQITSTARRYDSLVAHTKHKAVRIVSANTVVASIGPSQIVTSILGSHSGSVASISSHQLDDTDIDCSNQTPTYADIIGLLELSEDLILSKLNVVAVGQGNAYAFAFGQQSVVVRCCIMDHRADSDQDFRCSNSVQEQEHVVRWAWPYIHGHHRRRPQSVGEHCWRLQLLLEVWLVVALSSLVGLLSPLGTNYSRLHKPMDIVPMFQDLIYQRANPRSYGMDKWSERAKRPANELTKDLSNSTNEPVNRECVVVGDIHSQHAQSVTESVTHAGTVIGSPHSQSQSG